MAENDFNTLEPKESVALWLKGKDVWNAWVEQNPEYNVSFESVDFSKHLNADQLVDFQKFCFPNGDIDFSSTKFGTGSVFFGDANF